MTIKKITEKIEDTLSCFFQTNIKLLDATILHGKDMVALTETKRVYFNNEPTDSLIPLSDLKLLSISDKKVYDAFMIDLLGGLKEYK